jgi:hypothetical protein
MAMRVSLPLPASEVAAAVLMCGCVAPGTPHIITAVMALAVDGYLGALLVACVLPGVDVRPNEPEGGPRDLRSRPWPR